MVYLGLGVSKVRARIFNNGHSRALPRFLRLTVRSPCDSHLGVNQHVLPATSTRSTSKDATEPTKGVSGAPQSDTQEHSDPSRCAPVASEGTAALESPESAHATAHPGGSSISAKVPITIGGYASGVSADPGGCAPGEKLCSYGDPVAGVGTSLAGPMMSIEQSLLLEGYRIMCSLLNTTDSRDWTNRVARLFRSHGMLIEFKLEGAGPDLQTRFRAHAKPLFSSALMGRLNGYDSYIPRDTETGEPLASGAFPRP